MHPDLSTLDQAEFGLLLETHRREILAHCYRMTGSLHDAEDLAQETFLRAWHGRAGYQGRASLRAWIYRIATNACLDALAKRKRRVIPRTHAGAASDAAGPIPSAPGEILWLEPCPDELCDPASPSPESIIEARESISIAFMALLQRLPPRQRAVLILRDVLDWSAAEVSAWLGVSVAAVKSMLHRARAGLAAQGYLPPGVSPTAASPDQVAAWMRAWEEADIEAFVQMLSDDATFSMPPIPSWYQGRESIRLLASRTVFAGDAAGRWRMVPTRANAQPAFGLYRLDESAACYRAYGIQVLTLHGAEVTDVITFRVPGLVARFGLPESPGV